MPRVLQLVALSVAALALALAVPAAFAQERHVEHQFPLAGTESDIVDLAGDWVGGYEGTGNGRSGIVAFRFSTRMDTAEGHVVMIPHAAPGAPPRPVTLRVFLVWVADGEVEGQMEPYTDPELGIELETWFYGRLVDGRLEGEYESGGTTVHTPPQAGRWWAQHTPVL
jgi:hypothetical protein